MNANGKKTKNVFLLNKASSNYSLIIMIHICTTRELKQARTIARTLPNKRFNEQNNGCTRACEAAALSNEKKLTEKKLTHGLL